MKELFRSAERDFGLCGCWSLRLVLIGAVDWNDRLRLAPLVVASADHDVETPVAALFFRLHQAKRLHVEEVVLHPTHFLLAQATALQVDRHTRKMGRSCIALSRSSIAIVPPKFLLHFHRAYRGVHLNLVVEAMVVGLAEVLDKISRPRTAITPRRIQRVLNAQSLAGNDRHQRTIGFQSFQLGLVLNARQLKPVDFSVLNQERFVGRPEHRIPAQPAEPMMRTLRRRMVHSKSAARHPAAYERKKSDRRELNSE